MENKTTEWMSGPVPTVCRCCLAEGCYKDISTEYFWMGKREVYAEMLSETFDLSIAYAQSGGPNSHSRLICEPCISRLRDASEFKKQVQECEKTFMNHLDPCSTTVTVEIEPSDKVKLETVKEEQKQSDSEDFEDRLGFEDDDDDDLDDQPLTKLASKPLKKEKADLLDLLDNSQITVKRKSTLKAKAPPAKKAKLKIKEKAKPSPSKAPTKTPKKKKEDGVSASQMAKQNARIVLKYSTVYPFRLRGKFLYCVYCSEQYDDPSTYRKHMDTNHKKFTISTAFAHCRQDTLKIDCTNLKCRICSEPFDRLEQVARHIRDQHSQKKLNLDFEIGLQPYKIDKDKWCCYICDHKLPSLVNLCRHTTSHYKKYACDICGKAYMKVEGLRYHIRCTHSGSHTCRRCWEKFPTLEAKREHAMTSQKCWSFCCVTCGERFKSWEFKQKHLLEAHGMPQRTYKCPECSLVFESRKVFYKHYKLTHTDEGFACPCCGVVFSTKRCLENHRVGHTGERQHVCSVCSKAFTRASSLQQHMWIHSEMKRFSCLVCDNRVFSQKVSLKAHMKSYHPDVSV